MEMRYEMGVTRAMSDNGMMERADSENGCYSDDGQDHHAAMPRRQQQQMTSAPGYAHSDAGSYTSDFDFREARKRTLSLTLT